MSFRVVVYFPLSLMLFVSPVYAAVTATTNAVVVASAEPSSQDNASDDSKKVENDDTKPNDNAKAESGNKKSQTTTRREPEPLTLQGAVGLVLIIAAIGGFSYWAMRPLSRKSDEDDSQDNDKSA